MAVGRLKINSGFNGRSRRFPTVHYLYVSERKKNIVKRTAPKAIKKPKVIWNIEEPKANKIIKTPKEVKVDDKRKRYVNSIMLNYVLRPTYLAASSKIKKKNEEWQQKLKAFEEVQ